MPTVEERFLSKVEKGEICWEWIGANDGRGYGQLYVGGKLIRAHRLSFMLYVGKIPKGLHILHKCDNPSCVNPDHLFIGTHRDNMQDMSRKGRHGTITMPHKMVRGENNGLSKLTEQQVLEIRELYSTGDYLQREIGCIFNVSQRAISKIINFQTWAHISDEALKATQ